MCRKMWLYLAAIVWEKLLSHESTLQDEQGTHLEH